MESCRFEARGRLVFQPGCVAKLDLAASVGHFLGHHPVSARPTGVKAVGMASPSYSPLPGKVRQGPECARVLSALSGFRDSGCPQTRVCGSSGTLHTNALKSRSFRRWPAEQERPARTASPDTWAWNSRAMHALRSHGYSGQSSYWRHR